MLLCALPKVFYQPDFVLIGKKGLVVIEIELTTDAIKQLVGDIVRAGLINATYFIGISRTKKTKRTVEIYGEVMTKKIKEIENMKVVSICYENDSSLKESLKMIL